MIYSTRKEGLGLKVTVVASMAASFGGVVGLFTLLLAEVDMKNSISVL